MLKDNQLASELDDVVQALTARLPELEWRLHDTPRIALSKLPRGLFQENTRQGWLSTQDCMASLRHDLLMLSQGGDQPSLHFIAQRLERKMNVLLQVCREAKKKTNTPSRPAFEIQQLSTRQQWQTKLHDEIEHLAQQETALRTTLEGHSAQLLAPDARLTLQQELGEVTRRLTLAREVLTRV